MRGTIFVLMDKNGTKMGWELYLAKLLVPSLSNYLLSGRVKSEPIMVRNSSAFN